MRKTVDAYGGEASLRKAAAVVQAGRLTSIMRAGKEGTIKRVYQRPDRLKVEVAFPGEDTEIRILNGKKGWRQGKEASGAPLDAMVLQAARFALPLSLLDREKELADRGTVSRDGTTLRAFELPLGDGLILTVEIEPSTGRIVRSAARGTSRVGGAEGSPIEFVTDYGDFRTVAGVLYPFKERNSAMGRHTGDTVVETVEARESLPPGTFKP